MKSFLLSTFLSFIVSLCLATEKVPCQAITGTGACFQQAMSGSIYCSDHQNVPMPNPNYPHPPILCPYLISITPRLACNQPCLPNRTRCAAHNVIAPLDEDKAPCQAITSTGVCFQQALPGRLHCADHIDTDPTMRPCPVVVVTETGIRFCNQPCLAGQNKCANHAAPPLSDTEEETFVVDEARFVGYRPALMITKQENIVIGTGKLLTSDITGIHHARYLFPNHK